MPSPALILNDEPNKTRADYANLSTDEIYRRIGELNARLEEGPLTEDAEDGAKFALQELRAVLLERSP